MKFTYSSGARPLDGYTIKRGIGHGGFGEVYYALSDGGKEVALKLVRQNLEVELRGMAQCLNLKHTNLVALYDIRSDGQGDSWVIMEYVNGESLNAILNRHPHGMPHDLVQQWFLALAKAIGYLHDNGIVHRDVKPGNIFVENGLIKVGDYGLSKFISCSQRSAQTQSVGTVHYMAPEISTGKYGKGVDIYAAGIILYEMLTGRVPFQGESAGEILMKHLTSPPDLTNLPPGYGRIVGTALAKNPANRYQSFADMAVDVEQVNGAPAAARAAVHTEVRADKPGGKPVEPEPVDALPVALTFREKVASLSGSMAMAVAAAGLCSLLWTLVTGSLSSRPPAPSQLLFSLQSTFAMMVFASWAILVPAAFWGNRRGDQWLRRGGMFLLGISLGIAAHWLNGGSFNFAWLEGAGQTSLTQWSKIDPGFPSHLFPRMMYFGIAFFVIRWWKLAERVRPRRFSFYPVLLAGCLSYLLMFLDTENSIQSPVALTLTAVIVQMVSPWQEPTPKQARRVRLRYA